MLGAWHRWERLPDDVLFPEGLHPNEAGFWFMMQVGMILGFITAYPVNWWLVQAGIKERMWSPTPLSRRNPRRLPGASRADSDRRPGGEARPGAGARGVVWEVNKL